ncbi:nickel-dependent hydrogenase large subunit [Streptosporangium sp. NBC_01755]|uniref:Ni/Fe hydrogenase subunit alpha n=1 Tax=unclassified Streptosporangium TaxID=2632669 RepID=UPI002DD92BB7|nr:MULTISPECIES: nickel-dependent hydrogenase large subunit [unclassified Streptosporangium]WSA25182.1 nickel-dependent hydrogenase large subunit [Streptosporangium sp. NBC_01810]WSD03478.1 nickel-dependent hydrogenase large subunit [Streptosporangium sp. NBC_01755]
MTHKTIRIGGLSRVEGEGALLVRARDGRIVDLQLRIYEPPRFFEALLRGRSYTEPPDITARICGICPVAYQMSACQAIEAACGVEVTGPLRDLRLLLYYGEWIESHALHIFLLHAPDFLGYDSGIAMAADHRVHLERGLALKKAGNELVADLSGRAIHPVNVRVGGFYRIPRRQELAGAAERLRLAREHALATVTWVAGFDFPDVEHDYRFLALRHPDEYAILSGSVAVSDGTGFPVSHWPEHVVEEQVPGSTALHARLDGTGGYLVGAMARYALNSGLLSPLARSAARDAGLGEVCRNPFRSIVVRAVEIVHACDEALRIIDSYAEPDAPAVPVEPRPGVGHGASEAPRGTLYHRYRIDDDALIVEADIVPPTSQNQARIEKDLWDLVEPRLALPQEELASLCERAVRNHDPCISCSTHFLDLRLDAR